MARSERRSDRAIIPVPLSRPPVTPRLSISNARGTALPDSLVQLYYVMLLSRQRKEEPDGMAVDETVQATTHQRGMP